MDTPKFSGLKKHIFIISQFLWVGIQARPTWVLCFKVSHKAAIKVSVGAGVSSEGLTVERSVPSSGDCGQCSVPEGCWSEATLSFLPLGFSIGQLTI